MHKNFMKINFQDTFNKELPADANLSNSRRQVFDAAFSYVNPRKPTNPELIHVSSEMAKALDIDIEDLNSEDFLDIFSGRKIAVGSSPYAMCYGGHQFGHWAGQLGDGRAINIGEIISKEKRWSLQLKGSGETPYSRSADGLAVLRSSIREHLCSEAMFHLGVPTTRSLSLMLSGDQVLRDVMYDGNSAYEKGAIVCRVAPSFIRFGNFQIFAARKDIVNLRKLSDYTIKHFFPEITGEGEQKYLAFFQKVVDLTLEMIIHWERVGFVHGVMNTDNMSILGLTIDYGPYGWLEGYNHGWTPNTTDKEGRRYRFGYQSKIALWNLLQLANTLYPIINDEKALEEILQSYSERYPSMYLTMMKAKIGLFDEDPRDKALISHLVDVLQLEETDMTIFFRNLANFKKTVDVDLEGKFLDVVKESFYSNGAMGKVMASTWKDWFDLYKFRLEKETLSDEERKKKMNKVNPKYVLRNYMAQLAIDAADKGDYSIIEELYELLKLPYHDQVEKKKWFAKRPEWARHKVGCSMLSCSS
jgi:uncharacterized protein YdiU (UPF0061 family)